MRINLLLSTLLLNIVAVAQKTETYYDYYWKPCPAENSRYYSITEKTDSGWLRKDYFVSSGKLQMQALFEDEACKIINGSCWYFFANGNISSIGKEIHGKQEGICMRYYSNGMMEDSALFHDGHVVDKRFRWHQNGFIADSTSRVNDSIEVQVGWFDDGAVAYAGHLLNSKLHGKWKYYYHNGQLSSIETYDKGNLFSAVYFDENGEVQADTSNVNREAEFKGGIEAWKKYLQKNLYWPANLQFTNATQITIGIDFTIDENGKVQDIEVAVPFHPEFDKIAYNIIKNSPAWIPATSHNRKIKAYRRQPITFAQN